MKVILYTALTPNGLMAKSDGSTDWLSKEDLAHFNAICQKTRAVIFGRKSWDEMNPDWLPFKEGEGMYTVLTRNKSLVSQNPKTIFSSSSPKEIINRVEKAGYAEVIVAGGGEIYSLFLGSGLVDEIYIDMEPYLFGKGIRFQEAEFELDLELLDVSKLNSQTLQLHYRVKK